MRALLQFALLFVSVPTLRAAGPGPLECVLHVVYTDPGKIRSSRMLVKNVSSETVFLAATELVQKKPMPEDDFATYASPNMEVGPSYPVLLADIPGKSDEPRGKRDREIQQAFVTGTWKGDVKGLRSGDAIFCEQPIFIPVPEKATLHFLQKVGDKFRPITVDWVKEEIQKNILRQ